MICKGSVSISVIHQGSVSRISKDRDQGKGVVSHDGDLIRITDDPIRDPVRVRVITAIRQ